MRVAVVSLLVCLLALGGVASAGFAGVSGGSSCAAGEAFFPSALSCGSCEVPGSVPAADGLGCVCPTGWLNVKDPTTLALTECTMCAVGSSSVRDGSACLLCGTGNTTATASAGTFATYDAASGRCVCPTGAVLVETHPVTGAALSTMECVMCEAGSFVDFTNSPYECVPCPQEGAVRSAASGECECAGPVFVAGPDGSGCLPATAYAELSTVYPAAQAARITYSEIGNRDGDIGAPVSLSSWLMGKYFPAAASWCTLRGDAASCQTLGNLCVLTNYDEDSAACRVFNSVANQRTGNVNGYDEWKVNMPWLEYGSAFAELRSFAVSARFTFSQDEENAGTAIYNMRYVLAGYSINGTLVSVRDVSDQLQLCQERRSIASRWRRFGTNLYQECVLYLHPMQAEAAGAAAESQLVFYDMYLVDADGSFVPVPVRLANLKRSGQYVNVDSSEFNDVLTRRFYLTDVVSGKRSADGTPDVVRVAQSLRIMVTLQEVGQGRIRPPLIDLSITERLGSTLSVAAPEDQFDEADGRPKVRFESVYTMDLTDFWRSVSIGFGVMLFVAVLFWLVRLYAWIQRNQSAVGTEFLGPMCAYLFSSLGFVLFWFVYALALYWLIFFKWQATVHVLLPTSSAHTEMVAVLATAFACQALAVLYQTYKQSSVDIFLMDWERPKGQVVPKDGDIRNAKPASISIWRTFFIANEWHELQTLRRISLEGTLFALLFLLRGLNLEYLATPQPAFTDLTPMAPNVILRFAVTASLWLLLGGAQIAFKFLILDRFFDNPMVDFVDLLSLSNISVFVLYERYAGFYLHGRSIYQHTDVSMQEMNKNLREEMEGMAPPRGLGENSECQTFEIFVTHPFRDAFDECYGDVTNNFSLIPCAKSAPSSRQGSRRQARMVAGGGSRLGEAAAAPSSAARVSGPSAATLAAYARVNTFLTQFIDRHGASPGADEGYRIESRPALSQLLHIPPDMGHGACVLNPAGITKFTNVTFYGLEFSLLLLNIMVYAITDVIFNNAFISALVTWLVEAGLGVLRRWMGAKNLTQKTLVDERFLI
ncbi:meckelin [Thecamonas trahens ATCC 50062]|uniref:Meckelin n=1 Tax=Thecamonas trahens ATCC 50062 TaxID=461836 RepID=A0A0L0D338_THETB|nr:meckelin [Thecamonas trahens ATCC 50062]KNC46586.1 meckelin [Thecamonas trahens ATCC 50062]|eukprot:XP_013760362.1 meckelin [Thecamonas trahens ATCC 50062]